MADRLNPRQQRFCEEYIKDFSGVKAAKRAGYKGSYAVRGVQASRLLKKDKIKAKIAKLLAENVMTPEECRTRMEQHARANIGDFLKASGTIDWEKVKEGGLLVRKVSQTDKGESIELYSSQAALEKIGKHLGLFEAKATGKKGDPIHTVSDVRSLTDDELQRLAKRDKGT